MNHLLYEIAKQRNTELLEARTTYRLVSRQRRSGPPAARRRLATWLRWLADRIEPHRPLCVPAQRRTA